MIGLRYLRALLCALFLAPSSLLLWGCDDDDDEAPEQPAEQTDPEKDPEAEPEPEPAPVAALYKVGKLDITTEGGAPITSKEDYVKMTLSLTTDTAAWNLTDVAGGIRGRGNSTWLWYDKKPYRLKLDKKTEAMGLPKNKSWVLLAEYRDPTSLMNAFVFALGRQAGLPATNHSRFVELTLNGEYQGLYHLTEQVQQGGEGRVEIGEADGILMQLDVDDGPSEAPEATDNFWSATYRMPVCVKNPEGEPLVAFGGLEAVKAEFAKFENAIHAGDYNKLKVVCDVKAFIDYLIIQEFVYNVELDAPRSMYMHHAAGGLWTMGPLWDFDGGFDFNWTNMETSHNYFASTQKLVLGTDPANYVGTQYHAPEFFTEPFKMAAFVADYQAEWRRLKPLIQQAQSEVLNYYDNNIEAWQRDATKWPIGLTPATEVQKLKAWITGRTAYMDVTINKYPKGK